jgi:LmbE family N-acetylglucosaminyl deacetylase
MRSNSRELQNLMVTEISRMLRLEAGTARRFKTMKNQFTRGLKRRAVPASKRSNHDQFRVRRSLAAVFVAFVLALSVAGGLAGSGPTNAQETSPAAASTAQAANRIELYQALLDMTNPWTVMCIAAHPDDEDGTSLTVMRRKYGAHTVSLFSTFGEGGQNAIGPELYEELGAIRARETMAAAEIQGSEPYFLGLRDFGFSKSADEAFRVWGHDEALRRLVLQIRKLRPDVIITNHSATSNDHGHHQATARLELEAFDAAADPKRFPEQLSDEVTVWQVKRLFVRVRSNQTQTDAAQLVAIDPNELDPVRGKTFAEEALDALQKHATQGPWPKSVAQLAARFNSSDGRLPPIRYRLEREAKGADALPKGSHNFIEGLRLPEEVGKYLSLPIVDGKTLTELVDERAKVFEALDNIPVNDFLLNAPMSDLQRVERFSANWNRALGLAGDVTLRVETSPQVVTPGSVADVKFKILNTGAKSAAIFGCTASIPRELAEIRKNRRGSLNVHSEPLNPGATVERAQRPEIPANAPINLPLSKHLYDSPPSGLSLEAGCSIIVSKSLFKLETLAQVDVAAPLQIDNLSPSPIVRTPADIKRPLNGTEKRDYRDFDFAVRVTNNQDSPFSGEIIVDQGFGRNGSSRRITIAAHDKADVTLKVPGYPQSTGLRKSEARPPAPVTVTVAVKGTATPLARLDVPVVWADARVAPNLRVGYVRGFDYSLPHALAALGVESKELTVEEVKTADLQKYTTMIVDNRVYESQPELIAANQKLLDYAKDGGTLIVFYHKSNEWNPDERRKRPPLAPYKLVLGDERVTDETAPITFLEPGHPLLNVPNQIGQADFANWIQERGLYYPRDWDPQFHALLQTNDPGEAPLKGGLLVADYGRGHYIYTSMVWYRELRAGVPGAYRVFANMISYK